MWEGAVRPSWNTKRLSKDRLREHLEETRLIDELGWARSAGSLEDTMRAARSKMPYSEHGKFEAALCSSDLDKCS